MKNLLPFLFLISFAVSKAQDNVGIGTTTPHPQAILELAASDKGFLMSRMNAADTAIPGLSQEGMFFYARDVDEMYFYDGTRWQPVPKGRVYWERGTGNNISNNNAGNVGINTNNPSTTLEVNGVITGDGSGLTNIAGEIPIGGIIMWSGSLVTLPANWQLCDGTNGTPNLSDRFLRASNSTGSNIGSTGGIDFQNVTISNMPAHSHTFSGTTSTGGNHRHFWSHPYSTSEGGNGTVSILWDDQNFGNQGVWTNFAGNHSHSYSGTTSIRGSGSAFDNRPAYYTIAYIMRIF